MRDYRGKGRGGKKHIYLSKNIRKQLQRERKKTSSWQRTDHGPRLQASRPMPLCVVLRE